jgi:predicted peroxiredoxin
MRVAYMSVTGPSDATRASVPFHLAVNGSTQVGQDVIIVLGGDATDVVLSGVADKVEGVGIPPLRELLAKAREQLVPVFV